MQQYRWDFGAVWASWPELMSGLAGSFQVFSVSLLIGMAAGLVLALANMSRHAVVRAPVGVLIEVLRATPGLVLLFWVFFALPILLGVVMDPFTASVITLGAMAAAFAAEVFRAGIESMERGQWDAARALAMTHSQAMRRIILPQAVKRMVPALFERSVELFKGTTLVSTVAFADLMFKAMDIVQQTFRPMEVYTVTALIYFVIIFSASQLVRLLERRLARSGESGAH